jgi:TRAP-type mannitol/chloroaromatic compound transport system permease small subunit
MGDGMKRILVLVDRTSTYVGKAVAFLALLVAVVIAYEIVMRTVFSRPTTWASEGTVFACGLIYLLGGAWTLLEDKHVRIDMLYLKFSPQRQALLDCLTYVFFCLYILVMLKATWVYMVESIQMRETTTSAWDPPIYPMKIAMATSLILLFLQGTARMIRNLYFLIKGKAL